MLILALILIPLLAALGIYLGAPARFTALIASMLNIAVAIGTIITNSTLKLNILSKPNLNLSLELIDGISIVMLLLAVVVTLAAALSGKCPEGREKLWYSSSLLISAGAIGAFISSDLFFFFAFHEKLLGRPPSILLLALSFFSLGYCSLVTT